MEYIILDDFEFYIDPEKIKRKLRLEEAEDILMIEEYCRVANEIARPKIALMTAYIDRFEEGSISFGDVRFDSRVLSDNLNETNKVVIYILTCGNKIYEWAKDIRGYVDIYVAEEIKILALDCAQKYFDEYIKENIFAEKASSMNPGSLPDWPISEQKKLFYLLSEAADAIGVELTDCCLMIPDKSVSGILFQKEKSFINCMLCNRINCVGRRAEFKGDHHETGKSRI